MTTFLIVVALIIILIELGTVRKGLERTNRALKVRIRDLEDDIGSNVIGTDLRTHERLSKLEDVTGAMGIALAADDEFDTFDRRIQMLEQAAGGFWKTKDGFVYMINTMDSDHLRNCLKGWARGETKNNMLRVLRARHVAAQIRSRDLGDELTSLGGDLIHGAAKRPGGTARQAGGMLRNASTPTYGGPHDSGNHGY